MYARQLPAVIAAVAFVCASSVGYADTPPNPVATSAADTKPAKKAVDPRLGDQTMVCKREETTGSRLSATTVCHTRADWATTAAEARRTTDHIQTAPQIPQIPH